MNSIVLRCRYTDFMRFLLIGTLLPVMAWGQAGSSLSGSVLDAAGVAVEAAKPGIVLTLSEFSKQWTAPRHFPA